MNESFSSDTCKALQNSYEGSIKDLKTIFDSPDNNALPLIEELGGWDVCLDDLRSERALAREYLIKGFMDAELSESFFKTRMHVIQILDKRVDLLDGLYQELKGV